MTRIFIPLLFLSLVFTTCYTTSPTVAFPAASPGTITFIGNAGSDNTFTVNQWKFDRLENLATPTDIAVTAVLDMTSITTGWKDLEKNLHKKKDYFYSKKFNTAQVTIDGAIAQADGSWATDAILTLKGVTKTVPMTFTLTGDGPYELSASAVVNRRSFKFTGNGPKDEVPVSITASLE